MELISADLGFIFFIFPGLLFSLVFIFFWLFIGNYFLQKIDGNSEVRFFDLITNFGTNFIDQNPDLRFSKGFIFLLIELATFFAIQLVVLNDFFTTRKNNSFLILFLLLLCLTFEMLYQLDLSSNFIFIGKIVSTISILLCLGFILIIEKSNSFINVSQSLTNNFNFFIAILFLIILFSISKLNSYMDYKKTPVFYLLPNDLNLYVTKIKNGNVSEKYVRWINESYSQIVLIQLVAFMIFPFLQQLINLQGPIWVQFFLLFAFQLFFLVITLFFSLLTPIMEFKIPNLQSKGIFILLFIIGLLIIQ